VRDFFLSRQYLVYILRGTCLATLFALAACSVEKPEISAVPVVTADGADHPATTHDIGSIGENSTPAIPIREFLNSLLASTPDAADAIGGGMNLPNIWMFSPQGNMIHMVSSMDELESFVADFQTGNGDPKLSAITCKAVEAAVQSVSQTEWDGSCGNSQWVALFLFNQARFDTCINCQEYISVLEQMKEQHTAVFQFHFLPLEMN